MSRNQLLLQEVQPGGTAQATGSKPAGSSAALRREESVIDLEHEGSVCHGMPPPTFKASGVVLSSCGSAVLSLVKPRAAAVKAAFPEGLSPS